MESVQKAVRDAADGLRNLAFGPQQVTEAATQHGEEPVAGVQGRGTPTDPYDAGNRDGEFRVLFMTTCWRGSAASSGIVCDGLNLSG